MQPWLTQYKSSRNLVCLYSIENNLWNDYIQIFVVKCYGHVNYFLYCTYMYMYIIFILL
jgi:hypothetical protein